MTEEFDVKNLTKEERIEYGKAVEARLEEFVGKETVAILRKKVDERRADDIESVKAWGSKKLSDLNHVADELQADIARAEWEKQQKLGADVHSQESYEKYLHERQLLILKRAAVEKQEKVRNE